MEPGRKRIKIIANPISGWGSSGRLARALEAHLVRRGWQVELHSTVHRGHARELAADVAGFDRVICVGGDGTMSEVVNGLPSEGTPPLGAIPSGTGNAYAKELGLPSGVRALADVIERGRTVGWDVGVNRTTGARFMMFAGAGFQAEVIRHFQRHRRGTVLMTQYLKWGFHVATRYPLPRIAVEIDGALAGRGSPWVEVFNISHYGGPLRIATHASPSDGRFDIMVFQGRKLRDIGRLLVSGFTTFALRFPYRLREMRFLTGRRVRLFAEDGRPVPYHMDGDYQGSLPADLELLPHRIRILAPDKSDK
jgi:diacylglycerol kinase (ATP)